MCTFPAVQLAYRLAIAQHFHNKMLWFPHFLDFRGRAYPISMHVQHMGDDKCRGMLQFAQGMLIES